MLCDFFSLSFKISIHPSLKLHNLQFTLILKVFIVRTKYGPLFIKKFLSFKTSVSKFDKAHPKWQQESIVNLEKHDILLFGWCRLNCWPQVSRVTAKFNCNVPDKDALIKVTRQEKRDHIFKVLVYLCWSKVDHISS